MDKKCDACEYLKAPNEKTRILLTENWDVGIGNNQAYFWQGLYDATKS